MKELESQKSSHPVRAFGTMFLAAQITSFLMVYIFPTFYELAKGLGWNWVVPTCTFTILALTALAVAEACTWIPNKIQSTKQVAIMTAMVLAWAFHGAVNYVDVILLTALGTALSAGAFHWGRRTSTAKVRAVFSILAYPAIIFGVYQFLVSETFTIVMLDGTMGRLLQLAALGFGLRTVWLCWKLVRSFNSTAPA